MSQQSGISNQSLTAPVSAKLTSKRVQRSAFWNNLRRDKYLYLLALPAILYFIVYKYVPMFWLIIAFQKYSPMLGVFKSKWVGVEHFERFFSTPDFWILFRNTMAISFLKLFFFFPIPIILSLLLNELRSTRYKRIIQSVIYLPHFLAWVIISGITFLMLSQSEGIVNKIFVAIGWEKFDFLTNADIFWGLIVGQTIWKECGWGTIIFLAAIAGVDPQLYEAAKMDGANRFRQMWHVTLPAIKSVIVILLILRLGDIMDVGFEHIYLMLNGAVSSVGDVFDTYVFRAGVQHGQFSYSTAIGLFKSLVGLILVIVANKIAKKVGEEGVY